ncbi:MAG: Rpn family recombination-promoting nuclease/putative transposase [Saprospiraceae bacterium]|nr:Rpn family recombination-promoting nuclease/putative transposase [Saprospiraceae bacterium]
MKSRPLVSFDWAIKKLLRQKANYDVLEGFLTVLLRRQIKIRSIPESEGNSEQADDKINKVDILCENEHKELILIELQYNSENDYFHRMLFGASKIITDYMSEGYTYDQVRKVYSINIVYFDLGQGSDYVYHGTTEFKGIHTNDTLQVNVRQKELFSITAAYQIYPEYYIIKVNKFNDAAKDSLDEWIYYLKNNRLPEDYSAPGLDKVAEILNYDNMDASAKAQYEAHQKELAISYGVLETAKAEGRAEGKAEGRAEGEEKGEEKKTIAVVINSYRLGLDLPTIALVAGISEKEVVGILKEQGLMN